MVRFIVCLIFINFSGYYCLPSTSSPVSEIRDDVESNLSEKWWTSAALYQIYPRSFQDSDGNGIGDLAGITSRLEYLKEIGISAFWLNPIFPSPLKDFGYDISNFYDIHSDYGTMEDFEKLVAKANELGIGVLLDFVPNHSSDQCEWFQKSIRREDPYTDYYIWKDGLKDENDKPVPPNNWLSVFGGKAWTWNDERQQFYYHQFLKEQPDLNYRNPAVVEQMNNVFQFWMIKGLSGFRIDATNHLFEDILLSDEPPSNDSDDPNDWNSLIHIHTKDQPECHEMVYSWRKTLDDYATETNTQKKILITEAFTSIENTMKYYVSENGTLGSHFPYNGQLLGLWSGVNANGLKSNIDYWMDNMPEGHVADWPIGSHDNVRVATRLGVNFVGIMNSVNLMLPGASITYYGDEIGMKNNEKIVNPADNRDPSRTPMQWDSSVSGGFSANATTWLPINDNYKEVNVETMKSSKRSHFHHFKELMELRKQPTIMHGNLTTKALSDDIFAFTRSFEDHPTFVVVANLGRTTRRTDLTVFENLAEKLIVESSVENSRFRVNDTIEANDIQLDGYDAIVLREHSNAAILRLSFMLLIVTLALILI